MSLPTIQERGVESVVERTFEQALLNEVEDLWRDAKYEIRNCHEVVSRRCEVGALLN